LGSSWIFPEWCYFGKSAFALGLYVWFLSDLGKKSKILVLPGSSGVSYGLMGDLGYKQEN